MNAFTDTVKTQTIWLDSSDAGLYATSVSNCYWYENRARKPWSVFMPAGILERAFYKAMQDFPILAGHPKTSTKGRLYVLVDKDNLNMPVYTDTYCNLDYSEMHESGYNIHKLPMDFSKEYGVPVSNRLIGGRIVPGFFHVIRFRENSGLMVIGSIRHHNTDGYGYTQFMNRWAEIAKWMQQSQSDNSVPFPVRHYIYDRSFDNSYISSETTAIKDMISNPASSGGVLMKWLAWISPEMRGRVMGALSNSTDRTCSFYYISSKTMEDLRTRVQAHAPEGIRYSVNDVLTAYLAIVLGQAKEEAFIEKWKKPARSVVRGLSFKKLGKPKDLVVMIDINSRPRINLPDAKDYIGNMISGSSTVFSREQVHQKPTDEILSAMALRIHQDVASVDKEFIAQVSHFKNGKPEYYMWPAWFFATRSSKMGISNQFRFEHYGVDFGAGIPTMARTSPHAFVDNVFVMPANPAIGGYIVEFKLEPDVKANLARNEKWMSLVDKYDSYLQLLKESVV
ncbi:hypothetical protein LPJ72_001833 [Coemansia sp. Benny D160-2]|nr:hypothetical protein LPJ72_001833 [Coemansia sp. Benny D160-2]